MATLRCGYREGAAAVSTAEQRSDEPEHLVPRGEVVRIFDEIKLREKRKVVSGITGVIDDGKALEMSVSKKFRLLAILFSPHHPQLLPSLGGSIQ